jgi:hypothetical protein
MELYRQKSWWKIVLVVIGMIILTFTMVFTNYLSKRMGENERKYMEFYNKALNSIMAEMKDTNFESEFSGKQRDYSLELYITENVKNKIILDDGTNVLEGFNWGEEKDTNQAFLLEQLLKIKESGVKPMLPQTGPNLNIDEENIYPKIYYKYNDLYILITWFPLIQVALLALFIFFGYTIFSSIKKSEQNRVWAGMAKETAHQLGTPISGIIGWTEYLKNMTMLSEDQFDAVTELENDVKKLDLIADRFSKIGSVPVLENKDINDVLSESVVYIKKRSPKNIVYIFDETANPGIEANINDHLFSWVVENILRNALDAMGDKGTIKISTGKTQKYVFIDLTDSGKGISSGKFKTVFKPGFSTKKRGWGLGLSLAKRIIEDYHNGKIFVLKSKINEGTTFRIMLPIVKK